MQGILSAVFDNRRAAEAAIADLVAGGFARTAIHLGIGDPTGADSPLTGNGGESGPPAAAVSGVGNFLNTLFGTDNSEHVQSIAGAVTHSHLVLTLSAPDLREAERAASIVRGHAPVRIDTAASTVPAVPPGPLSQLQAEPPGRAAALEAQRAAHEPAWRRHHAETRTAVAAADPASPFPGDEHYDEYAPAYLYGLDMATHEQHGGREWAEAEADLRGEWERRHPQSAWAKFREAVRHSWEKLRGEM